MPLAMSLGMVTAAMLLASAGDEQAVQMKLMGSGIGEKLGYYMPQKLELTAEKPASVKKLPEGLSAPLFGEISMGGEGGKKRVLVVDEPDGKPAKLLIDSDGDGDLTNDPEPKWEGKERGGPDKKLTMYFGNGVLKLGTAEKPYDITLNMYRFDKNDPDREQLKMSLLYYRDYATVGEIKLGEKTMAATLVDERADGDFTPTAAAAGDRAGSGVSLVIDVNGNGKVDSKGERFDAAAPFNIGGVTYELKDVAKDGLSFKVVKSEKTVEEIPLPPDHGVGRKITAFEAKTMDGKDVKFPGDYKGKVVLIDFWATWCGPCIAEMPNVSAAYKKHHAEGFEILGISFDRENAAEKIKASAEKLEMPWAQVYEGKFWGTAIGKLYSIDSIPAAFLVDGDTGLILAERPRGEALEKAVSEALARKKPQ